MLSALIDECAHLAPCSTSHDGIANFERALVNQHCGNRTATNVEVCFENNTLCTTLWVRREFFKFCNNVQLLKQVVDAEVLLCRHLNDDGVATPCFRNKFVLGQLRENTLWVCVFLVDLVDRHNDGNISRACVVDCFNCLRHHTVVSCNNKNHDVGDLCTAHTHLRERSVTWCVDEGDHLAVFLYLVCTDVLRDAAGFASNNIRGTNAVEKRRLTVVNVTHNGDDCWACCLQCLIIVIRVVEQSLQFSFLLLTWIDEQNFCADFHCEQFHLLVAKAHGGCHHFAMLEQVTNNICCRTVQLRSELLC